MVTTKALVGLAHFLMQADPNTAQQVFNQLQPQESEQVIQIIQAEEMNKMKLPVIFKEKITGGTVEISSPSHETSAGI